MPNENNYRWLGQSKINDVGGVRLPTHIQQIMQAKPTNYMNYFMELGTGEIIITISLIKKKV